MFNKFLFAFLNKNLVCLLVQVVDGCILLGGLFLICYSDKFFKNVQRLFTRTNFQWVSLSKL